MKETRGTILFLLEHFYPYIGGAETLFYQLAAYLVSEGFRVEVVTLRYNPVLPVSESLEGINIHRIRAGNRYLFTFLAIPRAVLFARRASIIHTSTYNAAIPAWIASALTTRKVVITVHEVFGELWFRFPWMSRLSARFHHLFESILLLLPFHHYIAVSSCTAASLQNHSIPVDKITTIYNGLEYSIFNRYDPAVSTKATPSSPTFIYFGRLGHSKGLNIIVRGGADFLKSNPDASIQLIVPAEPGKFRKKLESAIQEEGMQSRMIITPSLPREELVNRLKSCTAVLIPSYSEGFCYAATECAAMEVPVITSGRGALSETAGGKVILMRELTPQALTEAMAKACEGKFEIRPVRKFPLDLQIQQYLSLYHRLL
jgi:glycosyltransferase involved in cell wall biosynthesis